MIKPSKTFLVLYCNNIEDITLVEYLLYLENFCVIVYYNKDFLYISQKGKKEMALPDIPIDVFFPIIKQAMLDAYKVDSVLLQPPYSGFERLDMGMRRMAWGTNYSTSLPIFSLTDDAPYQIIALESSLGFYNVIARVSESQKPDLIAFIPFLTEPISSSKINKIMKENGVPVDHADDMQRLYLNLPIVPLNDFILTFSHLVTAFLPAFASNHVHYISYSDEKHEINPSETRFQKFSADYIEHLINRLTDCTKAISSGNQALATEKMKALMDCAAAQTSVPLAQTKQWLLYLNIFIAADLFNTAVHPYYTFQQLQTFEWKINETSSLSKLNHLPFEMARKYSMLAKNYTFGKYSYLIRNIINYIHQHYAAELSLSVLAEAFGKNASYLSNAFKKEVGDTLTEYISKTRIQASLRYFNTTNMSVADAANAVGISDFGYFSKLFKKYVGVSPREYKKMLDK